MNEGCVASGPKRRKGEHASGCWVDFEVESDACAELVKPLGGRYFNAPFQSSPGLSSGKIRLRHSYMEQQSRKSGQSVRAENVLNMFTTFANKIASRCP